MPPGVKGGRTFENNELALPPKPLGYYREFDLVEAGPAGRGTLRLVLGDSGEVYITGDHYDSFRQVINMPE